MKKKYLIILLVPIIIFITLILISEYNISKITPTDLEIKLIKSNYGNIKITNESDVIRINNLIVDNIKSELNLHYPIDINNIILKKKGFCYDRSLILQKIFILNKIRFRPIYLYYYNDNSKLTFFDIFSKNLNSHNIFEFKFKGNWYMMRTNTKMHKLETLNDYLLSKDKIVPNNTKYIKYLNNRNSKFIYPSWIPDIYFYLGCE